MGGNVVLTFENLYEVFRREKNNEDLQKIEENFFDHVMNYLREKQESLAIVSKKTDIFSHKEKENLTIQINNIKKILKDFYNYREKKIINLALNKSRTNSSLINTSSLTVKEKKLFEKLSSVLKEFRDEFLKEQLNQSVVKNEKRNEKKERIILNTVKLEFLENVDTFIGRELEEYGPYKKGEITELPKELAEILINERKAKKVL